jgi:hypothetical protein
MTTAAPPEQREVLVNFGGRVRESLRRRARMYAAAHDVDLQRIIDIALDEYLTRNGA